MANNQKTNDRDAMSLLSTYTLQGWVMTNSRCEVPDCPVPIMRSKDGSIRFCVVHDPLPTGSAHSSQKQQQQQPSPRASSSSSIPPKEEVRQQSTRSDQTEHQSIDKMDEARLRREQSSRASKLIGEKLLQRWALLNDICPNPACYAIPLMRDLNKHVVCVICGQAVLTEEQAATSITPPAAVPASQEEKAPVLSTIEEDPVVPVMNKQNQQLQQQQMSLVSGRTRESTAYSVFADAIAQKLQELTDRMTLCQDPIELKHLFEAIEAGVSALKGCEQLSG